MMREPFSRPFFAWFFYVIAVLWLVCAIVVAVAMAGGGAMLFGATGAAVMAAYGLTMIVISFLQAAVFAAIGYVVEKLAKIEWNTRPNDLGQAYNPASTTVPPGAKVYYYIDKGPLHGPLTAPDLLNLVRDGKLSIATRYFVEENGQRRALAHLSEINL